MILLAWWFLVLCAALSVVVSGFVRPADVVWYPAWFNVVVYLLARRLHPFRPPALVSTSLFFVRRCVVLV